MDINDENDESILNLIDLIDQEINKHYKENFIAGLNRAKDIIKEYFECDY